MPLQSQVRGKFDAIETEKRNAFLFAFFLKYFILRVVDRGKLTHKSNFPGNHRSGTRSA